MFDRVGLAAVGRDKRLASPVDLITRCNDRAVMPSEHRGRGLTHSRNSRVAVFARRPDGAHDTRN